MPDMSRIAKAVEMRRNKETQANSESVSLNESTEVEPEPTAKVLKKAVTHPQPSFDKESEKMAKKIAFVNPKGGSTKSTVAANTATYLAQQKGLSVLLVDLDSQADASVLSGINMKEKSIYEMYSPYESGHMFEDNFKMPSELVIGTEYGFDIIPGGVLLNRAESWITDATPGQHHLYNIFDKDDELGDYDFILVDTHGFRNKTLISSLILVDDVIVPTVPGELSTRHQEELFSLIEAVNQLRYGRPSLELRAVVVNRLKKSSKAGMLSYGELRESSSEKWYVAENYLPESELVTNAEKLHRPVMSSGTKQAFNRSFSNLMEEIF